MTSIEKKLIAIVIRELGVDPGQITTGSRLSDHGDSLDWLNLMLEVEKEFDVEISQEQSLSISTLGDLIDVLQQPSWSESGGRCRPGLSQPSAERV